MGWLSAIRDHDGMWFDWLNYFVIHTVCFEPLHFESFADHVAKSLGRVALIASVLCVILGVHLTICIQLIFLRLGVLPSNLLDGYSFESDSSLQMIFQWTVYVIFLCVFHLGEFFTTAVFNPMVTTADSFMVNHSKAYTTAALVRIMCWTLANDFISHLTF